jgi:ABC-type transport system involved in multi-copper enzyme maturation permease subunit
MRRVSRQWSFYVARSVLVGGLLVGLGAMWWREVSRLDVSQPRGMARAGEWYFGVIVLAQLSMVLLAAPAATAGAFGGEMARGHVCLMLVTGLTPLEIVLGTLAARLLPVLGAVACVVPVLALSSHLGGIEPQALIGLEVVTAGGAVLGCTLALAVSIGARRVHEVLVATYVLLAGWVLGYPILVTIRQTSAGGLIPGGWMHWLRDVNPYWLALGPVVRPGAVRPGQAWALLGGAVVLSMALAGLAACRLRAAALSAPGRPRRPSWPARLAASWPGANLDSNPVFWRECRLQQPSRWVRLLWGLYVAGAVLFTALAVYECATGGARRTPWAGPFNGFQAAVGLLLLSLVTPAALAEERARGSLEVLLSTPLSTRSLVLGKWWAHYRVVPCLALLPATVAAAHAVPHQRWLGVALVMGTVLAYGAAVTSLGIGLATWVSRLDRALTLSAAVSVFITVVWVGLMAFLFRGNVLGLGLASASPLLGVGLLTTKMAEASPEKWHLYVSCSLFWVLVYSGVALGLLKVTLATFDPCLGRVTPRAGSMHPGRRRRR